MSDCGRLLIFGLLFWKLCGMRFRGRKIIGEVIGDKVDYFWILGSLSGLFRIRIISVINNFLNFMV